MEKPREPDLDQKGIIFKHGLNSRNWLVLEETKTKLIVVYRYGETMKELDKNVNLWKEEKVS